MRNKKLWFRQVSHDGYIFYTLDEFSIINRNAAINDLKQEYDNEYFSQFIVYENKYMENDASHIASNVMSSGLCNYYDVTRKAEKTNKIILFNERPPIRFRSAHYSKDDIYTKAQIEIYLFFFKEGDGISFLTAGSGFFIEKFDSNKSHYYRMDVNLNNNLFHNLSNLYIYDFVKRGLNLTTQDADKIHVKVKNYDSNDLVYTSIVKSSSDFLKKYIEFIKEDRRDITWKEEFLENWIPFYKIIYRSLYDPGYKIAAKDIAETLMDVGLTITFLGKDFSTIGKAATS